MTSLITLCLFTKKPIPGFAKTRLQSDCSAAVAANIAEELIRASVELVVANWSGNVQLWAWPDIDHNVFRDVARRHSIQLKSQVPGNLGDKLWYALDAGVAEHGAAAVMGCDVPHCPPSVLRHAYTAMRVGKNVLGPSADGGFYFLGVKKSDRTMFQNVAWSAPNVTAKLLERLRALGIEIDVTLPVIRDIDTWSDLKATADRLPRLTCYLD